MDERDLTAALTGAETLDRHVRGKRESSGGDLTGTIYDVDPELQGLDRARAVMTKTQEAMDRNAGSEQAAEVTRASAEAAASGVKLAHAVEEIFGDQDPLGR
ncbi:hypothetical protein [Mycobacteroides abscessus]|uniref:hypothetical protein n=1 Tax=Mycobacteroides abscessus TaxID=36809 RepID=UPI000C2647C2|nr:hypothetical protein [Mycobacteroides abscessus]